MITIINNASQTLTNFPVKIVLTPRNFNFNHIDAGLTSLRFYDLSGHLLRYWIAYTWKPVLVWRLPSRFEYGVDRAVFPCMVDNNGVVYAWVNGNGMHLVKIFPNGSYVDVRDFSSPTYIWYCLYEPDSRRIILVGDHYDGYAYRAAVFVWYIDNDTVRYVTIPFTSLDNWLMSAVYYRGYYFFGEWERSSRNIEYSSGTYYPDSGGIWTVPADQILNSSAYRRIWEEPGGLGIYQFAVLRGHLYVFAKNATLARVYEYVNGKFILVREFRDVHASTVRLGAGLWSYSCDAYWQPGYRYLFIACQNTTTRTVHILTFDGEHWTDWNTGIPVNLDDYGVRITVMPDQKTVILQIMNSKTWEEHSIRTVYALYLDSHRIEPILITLGTGGAFKMTYALNKNCFAVGEYNKNNRARIYVICREAVIYVDVPRIPPRSNTTIYMIYSPLPATPMSSPAGVADFFTDFSSMVNISSIFGEFCNASVNGIHYIYVCSDHGTAPGNVALFNYTCTNCSIITYVVTVPPGAKIVFGYKPSGSFYTFDLIMLNRPPPYCYYGYEYWTGSSWKSPNLKSDHYFYVNDSYIAELNITVNSVEGTYYPNGTEITLSGIDASGKIGVGVSAGVGEVVPVSPMFYRYFAVLKYIDPYPTVIIGNETIREEVVQIPSFSVKYVHYIVYSPESNNISSSIAYSVNSSVVSVTGSGHVVTVSASPYINDSGWLVPTQNSTIYGTWLGGSLSSLSGMDYNYLSYESYNSSNTMMIVLQFNITGLGWLVSDSRVTIRSITVKVAGNLSKTVNTIASLEIYNFTGSTWQIIDPAALNQTVDTEKTYSLTGNLRDLISSGGVVMLRINITDVQSYPSTLVTLDLDELKILITYQNASDVEAIHTVTISLPYGGVNVSRLVLYARYGGTPLIANARVYIYNSTGGLVTTSILNMSSTWTENSIVIDRYMKSIEIRLVTYIESSPVEESNISIGYVEVYTNHSSWIGPTCILVPGSRYFNCSLSTGIELGSPGMVNSSTLYIYVIDKLRNVSISYPVPATYVSTTSMSGRTYNVYEIENALNETELRLSSLLENTYVNGTWNVTVHGRELDYAVVGDRVCVVLPEPGNITIITFQGTSTLYNISNVCVVPNASGVMTMIFSRYDMENLDIGYAAKNIAIEYGNVSIVLLDAHNMKMNYTSVLAILHGEKYNTTRITSLTGTDLVDRLSADNYTVKLYYYGILIGEARFNVNSLNPSPNISVRLNMLDVRDYIRNRTLAWKLGVKLIELKSLDSDYPYSRMFMLFNGSHGEKFCIAVTYAKKPTRVEVLTNGSEMYYDWVGNTLRICERMGSPTYVETIDMYMLRIVLVDMLNRTLSFPVPIYVNSVKHVGNMITMFVTPGTYVIDIPQEYTYRGYRFTLVNRSRIVIHVNDSDVVLRIVYRVPLKISAEVVSIAPGRVYVTGRAVDYRNSPVPDLTLIIVEKCSNGTEIDSDVVTTGEDGSFISKPFRVPKCGAIFNITYFGSETYEPTYTVVKLGVAPRRVVNIRLNLLSMVIIVLAISVIAVLAYLVSRRRGQVYHIAKMFRVRY